MFERGFRAGINFAKGNYEKQIELGKELMKFLLNEFNFNQVPSWIGSQREKIVQRVLGINDPYKELKIASNKLASEIWGEIKTELDFSKKDYKTFKRIITYAAVANSVEWFISGYDFSANDFKHDLEVAQTKIALDETLDLWNDIQKSKSILYILDNAGEAVIDLDVVKYIKEFIEKIFVAAREKPILNDITFSEAIELGFGEIADEIIPVGWFIGVHLDKADLNPRFREVFNEVDLVIAKGMGAYESLSEYKFDKPVYVILKAKCEPVAENLRVPRGYYVIKKLTT